jgi:hypothetical protein
MARWPPSTRSSSRPARRKSTCRLLPGRHAADDDAGLHGRQEGQARRFGHLLHDHARLLGARRTRRLHRRRPGRPAWKRRWPSAATSKARKWRHLQHAARQRPDLVLRGQQLPDGQGPLPLRPAVLELRLDAHAGDAQLLPAQHVPRQQAARTGRHRDRRCGHRHLEGQDAVLLHLHRRRPHRAVEEHLHRRPPAFRSGAFVLGGSGHIAGIVNPPAANKYGYWTNEDWAPNCSAPVVAAPCASIWRRIRTRS